MKDLNPSGNKRKSPKKKEAKKTITSKKKIIPKEDLAPNLAELAKNSLKNFADDIQGPEVAIENRPQKTPYLEEGSSAQKEALEEAVHFDSELIVSHDYGSSEWKLITSAINEKIDYRSLTHAMPLGSLGKKGVLIKTMVIMSGSCAIHTIIDKTLKIHPDPEAPNLFILK